jgi:hypothetical protein
MGQEEEAPDEKAPEPSYSAQLAALPGSSWVAKQLGGDGVLNVVTKPDRGSAFRIQGSERTSLNDIPVIAGPNPVAPEMLGRIASVLAADGTYRKTWTLAPDGTYKRTRGEKGCEPEYGVRLRFEKGKDVVDVFICFACAQMRIVLNGKRLGLVDFDPGEADLIEIARGLFTDDPDIQSLKPHGSPEGPHPQPPR